MANLIEVLQKQIREAGERIIAASVGVETAISPLLEENAAYEMVAIRTRQYLNCRDGRLSDHSLGHYREKLDRALSEAHKVRMKMVKESPDD